MRTGFYSPLLHSSHIFAWLYIIFCYCLCITCSDAISCPRKLYPDAQGHFIAGSISWKTTGHNSVEVELHTTWRLSFSWPHPRIATYSGPCGKPGIGDTVPLVGLSADPTNQYPEQSAAGHVSVILQSGSKILLFTFFLNSYHS